MTNRKGKERGHLARIVALATLALALLAAPLRAQTLRDVVAGTNGALAAPTNFFAASGVPTLAGSNAFTGTNTFSRVNIGSTNFGWRYATNNGGQIELAFPGGTAAWYQTGSPAIPYMYFAGTVQADTIVGEISATSINAEALGGQIPSAVVGQSLSPTVQNWLAWQNHSQPAGVAWTNSGPAAMEEPVPAGAYYFPAAYVADGGDDYVNTLDGKYLDATNAAAALGAAQLGAATNVFTGSATLGDASGDTVTINAGTFTAPNATNTAPTAVANVASLDGLAAARLRASAPALYAPAGGAITSTGVGGGTASTVGSAQIRSGTNQWSYAWANSWLFAEAASESAGDTLNFAKPCTLGVSFCTPGLNYRGGESQIFWGVKYDWTGRTSNALVNPATRGVGWRISGTNIVATKCTDAGTYSEVATNSTLLSSGAVTRQNLWLLIEGDGNGVFRWYANGTLFASTTNGPSTQTSANEGYFAASSVAATNLANNNDLSISAILFDVKN